MSERPKAVYPREGELPVAREHPFITNTECPYFPCHTGIDPADFNCLFCFCPLYMLGPECGGNFRYNAKGAKVCTDCNLPHRRDAGNRLVAEKWPLIKERAADRPAFAHPADFPPANGEGHNGEKPAEGSAL